VWETLPSHLRPPCLLPIPGLSQQFQCEIIIASETFQYTGSFKFRAAYNLLSEIPHKHVIAASSGNFGRAVANACSLLGKTCTIVMPETSARVKIEAVRAYGGNVDLIDVHKISRAERVAQLMKEQPEAFEAPAYDDYRVVAGNSTLGKDIFASKTFNSIIAPVGGGGLSAGLVVARDYLNLRTEIVGVEPVSANDAARSLRSGQLVCNDQEPATIADGVRTISLGKINWEILSQGLENIIEVPEDLIITALRYYFRYLNLKVEPTGALTLAALLAQPERFQGKRVCCIASGGNVDPSVYAQLLLEE
jgi:threonine dehydratase